MALNMNIDGMEIYLNIKGYQKKILKIGMTLGAMLILHLDCRDALIIQ